MRITVRGEARMGRLELTLGETLMIVRRRKGLNQTKLAKAAGVSLMTIQKVEAGDKSVKTRTLNKILVALNLGSEVYADICK